ncbi:MAG TPA: response regulator transcription factor [Mycobacteriales bacterium]|nr:response regulator transcription factor [Mycobacteriales bacterium]
MTTVLVVDDQELVREGLRLVLDAEADLEVVGEAGDGDAAVREALRLRPDVVLMDVRMPGTDGLTATRRLLAGGRPGPKVLVLTTFDLDQYVFEALRAGASGFLLKSAPRRHLVHAVRSVADGDALLDPSLTRRLVEDFVRRPPPSAGRPAQLRGLTDREVEVLTLVAQGLSNAEVAARLVVGETTVKTHVGSVFAKLGLRDRVQAVVLAYECGLVRPGG